MSELALKLIAENKAKHARGEDARVLDLGNCGLTEVPEEVGELVWLEELTVSHKWYDYNKRKFVASGNIGEKNHISIIRSLPPNLKTLIIAGSYREEFNINDWKFLINLSALESLNMSRNNCFQIDFFDHLKNLSLIDLSYNQLSYTDFLTKLGKLAHLNLSCCIIKEWEYLGKLKDAKTIDLSGTRIDNYHFLEKIIGLRSLDLTGTQLRDANFLEKNRDLTFLKLSGNQIEDISFLEKTSKLSSLNLNNNKIRHANLIGNLNELNTLYINNNHGIMDWSFLNNLSGLRRLDISDNNVSDWRFLKKMNELSRFYYANFDYKEKHNIILNNFFPTDLTKLTHLDLSNNKCSDWLFLERSTKLIKIKLSDNEINDASFLKNFSNLTWLNLDSNHISDIGFLEYLPKLTRLNLGANLIKEAQILENLGALTKLDLNNNEIVDVGFLNRLTKLEKLDLRNNRISSILPLRYLIENKGFKVSLEEKYSSSSDEGIVYVKGNPLTHPPEEVIRKGTDAILQYFDELEKKQQFKNTQIKLILLGNPTTGKTTLSRYLREQTYDPTQATTHGIQNHRWQGPPELNDLNLFAWRPKNKEMEISIWDFGGQEYYHATHRLFLSRNAVYALVWDAKTDKGGIEPTEVHYENDPQAYTVSLEHFSKAWWLKNIHFNLNKYVRHEQEGDAPIPVLLVQNKCAAGKEYEEKSVPREFEQKPYFLKPTWTNYHIDIAEAHNEKAAGKSGKWTKRFELFEQELLETLESQMETYEFAVYHRDIRDRVRALASGENPVNEMSWAEFEAMCRDIEPDAKMDLVQIYLRDITGDILYFEQNERLRHRVFLRPDWVCNRIYAILSRKVLEREGLFDLDWVREALHCEESEALDFVELMCEFQLVFEENNENREPTGNFVAPQYLPDACTNTGELEGAKKYANLAHAFTLWFPEFLPKSHIARFVAYWGSKAKQRLFWKNGLLFQTDGCTALVERLADEGKIRVEIQSESKNRAAAMRRIFQSFLDLEDGVAGFAVSLDEVDFVLWRDIQEAIRADAKKVKIFSYNNEFKYVPLPHFFITTQQRDVSMKHKIRALLQEAKTKEALELLASVVPDASALLTTFNEAKRRNMLGVLSFEAFSQKQNEVTLAAIDMLAYLQDNC